MKFNKLIRDKIIDTWDKENKFGKNPKYHIADDNEYCDKLKEKLIEEVNEYIKDENFEELSDILEVIDAICNLKNISKKDLLNIKKKKLKERGGFKKRLILEDSED